MSYGALSPNAVRALSRGPKMAGCYMSTGEGSLSPYHVEGDGDILYQIGPAKFGCRTPDGRFDDEKAAAILGLPQIKMVEIMESHKPGPSVRGSSETCSAPTTHVQSHPSRKLGVGSLAISRALIYKGPRLRARVCSASLGPNPVN
jgi:hypothetical protein